MLPLRYSPRQSGSLLLVLTILAGGCLAANPPAPATRPAPAEALRKRLDPFYKKHVTAGGLLIVSSEKVSDYALKEAAYLVRQMLATRPDVLADLVGRGVYITVMAYTEMTTDMPETRGLSPWYDKRARGLGGNPVSCAEENLLSFRGDPYRGESIFLPAGGNPSAPNPNIAKTPEDNSPQARPPSVEDSPLAIVVDLTRRPRPVGVESVDRPLTDEMDRLREHGKTTAEFLLSCVPVDLGLEVK